MVLTQFEYKIIRPHENGAPPDTESELNELGLDEWELVTVVYETFSSEKWIFKRIRRLDRLNKQIIK